MGAPALIGITQPDGSYLARYLHWSNHPDRLIPTLREIWQVTCAQDSGELGTRLLSRDWSFLSAGPSSTFPALVIAGVGQESPGGSKRLHRGRATTTACGDMEWLYLLDTAEHTFTVYEATCHGRWLRHSIHHLHPTTAPFIPAGPGGPAGPCEPDASGPTCSVPTS